MCIYIYIYLHYMCLYIDIYIYIYIWCRPVCWLSSSFKFRSCWPRDPNNVQIHKFLQVPWGFRICLFQAVSVLERIRTWRVPGRSSVTFSGVCGQNGFAERGRTWGRTWGYGTGLRLPAHWPIRAYGPQT